MFAKVFVQIFDSSIADDYQLRHFFTDLIVLADRDGIVNMTASAISARTRVPLDMVRGFLSRLQEPDPESNTPDAEGRRIELIEPESRSWGWHIINYQKYRETASDEQRREKTKARVAKFKQKRQQNASGNAPLTQGNAVGASGNDFTSASPSASPCTSGGSAEGVNHPTLEEALGYFKEMPYSPEQVRHTFQRFEANNIDGMWMWGRTRVGDWRSAMEARMVDDSKKATNGINGADKVILGKEYERCDEAIKSLRASYGDHQSMDAKDKKRMGELLSRRKEIKNILGIVI